MSKFLFFVFLKGIIKKTVNAFSIISLFVLTLTFFLTIPNTLKSTIQVIALISAFLFSAYNLWKQLYIANNNGELVFNLLDSKIRNSVWQNAMPIEPSIYFDFDIQNRSSEKLILKEATFLIKAPSATFILSENFNALNLIRSNQTNRMENIYLPFDIPGRDHRILRIQYPCKFKDYTVATLISFLSQSFLYDFDFEFVYSDIDNVDITKKVSLTKSYESFKNNFIEMLGKQNRTDILNSINS